MVIPIFLCLLIYDGWSYLLACEECSMNSSSIFGNCMLSTKIPVSIEDWFCYWHPMLVLGWSWEVRICSSKVWICSPRRSIDGKLWWGDSLIYKFRNTICKLCFQFILFHWLDLICIYSQSKGKESWYICNRIKIYIKCSKTSLFDIITNKSLIIRIRF